MRPFVEQHLPAAGRGDHRLDFLNARILPMRAIGLQINVMQDLIFRAIGLVAQFNTAQILHPTHALHTGYDEAQRIAVLRAQHFAVLPIGHEHFIILNKTHRNRARHARAIRAFCQYELTALVICTTHIEQQAQRYAGELAARNHAVRVLHGGHRHIAPLHARVRTTFNEMNPAHRRQAHQIVHGEDHRHLEHFFVRAIDHEAMLVRLNIPPALVMPLKMQTTGSDDAK